MWDDELDEDEGDEEEIGGGGKGLVAFLLVLGVLLPKLGGGWMGIGPLMSVLLMPLPFFLSVEILLTLISVEVIDLDLERFSGAAAI